MPGFTGRGDNLMWHARIHRRRILLVRLKIYIERIHQVVSYRLACLCYWIKVIELSTPLDQNLVGVIDWDFPHLLPAIPMKEAQDHKIYCIITSEMGAIDEMYI